MYLVKWDRREILKSVFQSAVLFLKFETRFIKPLVFLFLGVFGIFGNFFNTGKPDSAGNVAAATLKTTMEKACQP